MFDRKILIIIIIASLIFIPASFAADGEQDNVTVSEDISDEILSGSISEDDVIGDYYYTVYFDASSKSDGSGTQSNPYKYLTSSRISGDTRHVFASGTYEIDQGPSFFFYGSATFEGNGASATMIKYTGSDTFLKASSGNSIQIKGLTISGANFKVEGTLEFADSVIENAKGVSADEYNNNYGGAVSMSDSYASSAKVIAQNTIFKNNNAEYGGAIYASAGSLTLTDCKFLNNRATQFGGSIAVLKGATAMISNCAFENDKSTYDAGASVYILNSKATITKSNFTNSSSFYGSAITSLNSSVTLDNIIANDNVASYHGGAIYSLYGTLKVTSSAFNSNVAQSGGAIFADNLTTFHIKDCSFNHNTAYDVGGAVFAYANVANIISNPSYSGNKAKSHNDKFICDVGDATIVADDYVMMKYDSAYSGSLPSKFDLRNYNQVSSIKNQANSGNCWAYATIAALESCILKATGTEYDLSEGNLKNIAQYFSDYGWQYETNDGGFYRMSTGYLLSWLGPVLESQDLTDDNDVISPVFDSLMHVQNVLFLQRSSYTDNDAIKEAIMKYGAVATEMYFANSGLYYSPSTGGYYYNGGTTINHAVSIVGWDDTFSRYNFPSTPAGDGAWIIKNSYGTKWGAQNSGFGYVSYYDTAFASLNKPQNTFTFILNDSIRFNKNYQYDTAGWTDIFVTGKNTIYYKNIFTAGDNENLTAFGTYFNGSNINWQAKIYVNDVLKHTQNGVSSSGYSTVLLDKAIPLKTGDKFTVEMKLSCDGYANFMICEHLNQYSSSKAFYSKGVSFFSYDGNVWTDLSDYAVDESYGHKYTSQVACIKAYTVLSNSSSGNNSEDDNPAEETFATDIQISNASGDYIEATVKTAGGDLINEGTVEFKVNGSSYYANVVNGMAHVNVALSYGNYLIEANYTGTGRYNTSYISQKLVIKKGLNLSINAYDISYGDDLIINISLTDEEGNSVSRPVIITVDGKNHLVIKDSLTVPDLNPGEYHINANVAENSEYLAANDSATVKVLKQKSELKLDIENVRFGENITVRVSLGDIESGNVMLVIDGNEYEIAISNSIGILTISGLDIGNYTAFVQYSGDDFHFSSANSTRFQIMKMNANLTSYCDDINESEMAVINIEINEDINGFVTVNINEKQYLAFINEGNASVKISDLKAGKYDYAVTFTGNARYGAANASGFFNVFKVNLPVENHTNSTPADSNDTNVTPTEPVNDTNSTPADDYINISAPDVLKYFGGKERFIVYATNSDGDGLNNIGLTIQINGNTYTRSTNNQGIASIAINLNAGTYDITTTCGNITLNSKVIIKDTVCSNDLVKVYRNDSQYYATFFDIEGNLLKNTSVRFNINGVFYDRMTNQSGVARLNINLNQGTYIITAENPNSKQKYSNNITVVSRIVENHDLTKYYRNSSQYVVRILDDDGSFAKANEKVTFNINGVFYERTTNATGHVKLNINLEPNDYIITAEYKGCKVSNNIKVKSILNADDLTMNYMDGSKFKVRVLDDLGNPASNRKVTFNINGVFYNRYSDSSGEAGLNINLQRGQYIITSTYNGLNIANNVIIN